MDQKVTFVVLVDKEHVLIHGIRRCAFLRHLNALGVLEHCAGKLQNVGRHRCREKQRLAVLRNVFDDASQVVDEAHVHHGVRFVEHEVVQMLQVYETLVHKVEQTTGRGDHDINAAPKLLDLPLLADAAKQRHRKQLHSLGVAEDVVFNLHRQFAGGGQDKSADGTELTAVPLEVEPVDHGQAECSGFARSGLRYAEDIMSGEYFWDGLGLDRGWGFVTQRLDGLQHGGAEAQFVK